MTYFSAPGIIIEKDPFRVVSRLCKITPKQLFSKSRKREIVTARIILFKHYKDSTKYSLSFIGKLVGNKDHATVIHGIKTYNNLYETDKDFRDKADQFNELI